jgi:putative Mg2+ transporter-C (MgtC) family protein
MAKISLAMLLGLLLGLERVHAHKTAGMRTYALVALASCAFVIVSLFLGEHYAQIAGGFNAEFIPGEIIVGVGFLGAGLIIFKDGHIENLTTAGGLWVCAGLGMMCGFGMVREVLFTALLTLFVMGVLSVVERKIRLHYFPDPVFEKELEIEKKPRTKRTRVVKVPVQ